MYTQSSCRGGQGIVEQSPRTVAVTALPLQLVAPSGLGVISHGSAGPLRVALASRYPTMANRPWGMAVVYPAAISIMAATCHSRIA